MLQAPEQAIPAPTLRWIPNQEQERNVLWSLSALKDPARPQVFVRVRPPSESESSRNAESVVSVPTTDTVVLSGGSEPKPFTFDYAADGSTTQDEMFQMIGKPFTDSCLAGYNGSIFAYGQTGSGKTFTMQGPELDVAESGSAQRGLIPRALEYLFDKIAQKTAGGKVLRRRPHD
jgi:kinesin family protein 15